MIKNDVLKAFGMTIGLALDPYKGPLRAPSTRRRINSNLYMSRMPKETGLEKTSLLV